MTSQIFVEWLNKWQTLISGGLAIAAALLSVFFLRRQIRQSADHEQTKLRRSHSAARATLPLSLSAIAKFALDNAQCLVARKNQTKSEVSFKDNARKFADIPAGLIENLARVIESTDNQKLIAYLSEMIAEIQVLNTHLEPARTASDVALIPHSRVEEWLVRCAKIYVLALLLSSYGRREVEDIEDFELIDLELAFRIIGAETRALEEAFDWLKAIQ